MSSAFDPITCCFCPFCFFYKNICSTQNFAWIYIITSSIHAYFVLLFYAHSDVFFSVEYGEHLWSTWTPPPPVHAWCLAASKAYYFVKTNGYVFSFLEEKNQMLVESAVANISTTVLHLQCHVSSPEFQLFHPELNGKAEHTCWIKIRFCRKTRQLIASYHNLLSFFFL